MNLVSSVSFLSLKLFSFPLRYFRFSPFFAFFALLCVIVLFSPHFRMYIRVYHGYVPGVVLLQVIRDGIKAAQASLPCAHWYSGARTILFALGRYFKVFFLRTILGILPACPLN